MPLTFPHRILSALAFAATVIVAAAGAGLISDDQFEQTYSWAVWCCLYVPFFTDEHERWIEAFAVLRTAWVAFVRNRP